MFKNLDEVKEAALKDRQVLAYRRFSVYRDGQGNYYIHHVGEPLPPGNFIIEYAQLNSDKWMQILP